MSAAAAEAPSAPPGPIPPAPGKESLGSRIAARTGGGVLRIFLILVALFWLMPTIGLLLSSLRKREDFGATGWWKVFTAPSQLTLDNYDALLSNDKITESLVTSIMITVPSTVLVVVISAAAAYAFAWMNFPGRDWWFLGVVAMLVVPVQVALIPAASLFRDLGIFGSVTAVVIFHTAFGLPFAVFLLRNFFAEIPQELLEAARLDGANEVRLFTRVVMPLGGPAIAALGIFQFLWVWNDMLIALVFADAGNPPITMALQQESRAFAENFDVFAPGAFISMAIPLVIFFAFQRQFVSGVMAGAVK